MAYRQGAGGGPTPATHSGSRTSGSGSAHTHLMHQAAHAGAAKVKKHKMHRVRPNRSDSLTGMSLQDPWGHKAQARGQR